MRELLAMLAQSLLRPLPYGVEKRSQGIGAAAVSSEIAGEKPDAIRGAEQAQFQKIPP